MVPLVTAFGGQTTVEWQLDDILLVRRVMNTEKQGARLPGKVALVTGGGNGIGRAYCLRLAAEGAKVAVVDIDKGAADRVAETINQQGAVALAIQTDISDPASTEEMARKTAEHFGTIDILVNNAAIFGTVPVSRVPFWEIGVDEWDRVMAVNIKGVWLCTRAVVPYMKGQGSGRIINMSSVVFHIGVPNYVHYVASRAAVIGMTRAMARELGEYNINVNSIAPGATLSEENPDEARLEWCKSLMSRRCVKKVEYPEDLTGTLVFLASADSDFISGQTIVVDGGEYMQ
ncbi:SDR family NAD(P)-dependent oxidoreductase [Chloroflexota bacterium]